MPYCGFMHQRRLRLGSLLVAVLALSGATMAPLLDVVPRVRTSIVWYAHEATPARRPADVRRRQPERRRQVALVARPEGRVAVRSTVEYSRFQRPPPTFSSTPLVF